jgi:pimeloyl-ACP methyl ester carboxylesterase
MSETAGMAQAPDGRPRIYWESTGEGPPVLLIMGLGLSGGGWWRTVPVLSRRLRVITFDHRGVGRSKSPTPACTTEAMADDAVAVLDALALETVHVYGFSLGGMVAQQVALRHPRRVRSLVLGATQPGGPRAAPPDDEVVAFVRQRLQLDGAEGVRAAVPYNYGPRCLAEHEDRIAEDIERRLQTPFSAQAYRAHLYAAAVHNCYGRLDRIEVPTLVVHGHHDRMIPVANARMLADGIPDSRLRILRDSGHLYPTEEPAVDEAIGAFFASQP